MPRHRFRRPLFFRCSSVPILRIPTRYTSQGNRQVSLPRSPLVSRLVRGDDLPEVEERRLGLRLAAILDMWLFMASSLVSGGVVVTPPRRGVGSVSAVVPLREGHAGLFECGGKLGRVVASLSGTS